MDLGVKSGDRLEEKDKKKKKSSGYLLVTQRFPTVFHSRDGLPYTKQMPYSIFNDCLDVHLQSKLITRHDCVCPSDYIIKTKVFTEISSGFKV